MLMQHGTRAQERRAAQPVDDEGSPETPCALSSLRAAPVRLSEGPQQEGIGGSGSTSELRLCRAHVSQALPPPNPVRILPAQPTMSM